jgi:hypothetical protein
MHTDLEHEQTLARALRELPHDSARPYGWDEFRRRSQPRVTHLAGGRALAAAVVVVVAASALIIRVGGVVRHPHAAPGPVHQGVATLSHSGASPGSGEASYAERYLASLPREPALVDVGTRAAVATLEDDIAQVDDLVSAARAGSTPPARLQALLDERTQLVSSLVQVRYAETLADASR